MGKYYTNRELILRLLWAIVFPLFFLMSPRPFYNWRNLILRLFGAKVGANVKIYPSAFITLPWLVEIGSGSIIGWKVRIYNLGKITIGQNTIISQYSHLCGGTHDFRNDGFKLLRTGLSVGNKVWIAADAFIGPNVNVGDGAVVGARAVVIKNVPPYSIVVGNPAKIIENMTNCS